MVDERINELGLSTPAAAGLVSTVDTSRLRAFVVRDGSTVPVPVKLNGVVWPQPDDRVLMLRTENPQGRDRDRPSAGQEWTIVAVTSRVIGPNFGSVSQASTAGTIASSTPVALPGTPAFTFTKRWDTTPLLISGGYTSFLTGGAAGEAVCSLRFVGATTQTYTLWTAGQPGNGTRDCFYASRGIPDATYTSPLPSGGYTVTLMWSRTTAGTLNQNTVDWNTAFCLEGGA
jgi:hypothetical protein